MGVTCTEIRDDLSARMDGEPTTLPEHTVAEHLETCGECTAWLQAARAFATQGLSEPPDLTAAILTAVRTDEARRADRRQRARSTRWTLALIALVQLALSGPVLIFGHDHTAPVHVAHEIGSFDAALAIGLLLAAIRPRLAAGMLPLVGVITGLLLITAASDVVAGRTLATSEVPHLVDLVGLLLLARLAAATGGWAPPRLPSSRSTVAPGRG